jgi:hypothetical protein
MLNNQSNFQKGASHAYPFTPTISERLGILPADVSAPEQDLPDTGEIAAPSEESSGQNTEGSSQNGVTDPLTMTGLADLSGTETLGEPSTLASPETALPDSISTLNPTDVTAPSEATGSLPTDSDEVLPPADTSPPDLGSKPSDGGAIDIALPETLASPEIPVIADTSTAITETAPPVGWVADGGEEIEPFASIEDYMACGWSFTEEVQDCIEKRELAEAERRRLRDLARQLGEPGLSPDQKAGRALLYEIAKEYGTSSDEAIAMMIINNFTQDVSLVSPAERYRLYERIGFLLTQGGEGVAKIKDIGNQLGNLRGNASDTSARDILFWATEQATFGFNQRDRLNVWNTIANFPSPIKLDANRNLGEQLMAWFSLGFIIDTYQGMRLGFLEAALDYDSAVNAAHKSGNNNKIGGIKLAGVLIGGGLAIYEGLQMSQDADFDYLGKDWPSYLMLPPSLGSGVVEVPFWVRNGIAKSGLVIGDWASTTGAGYLAGGTATALCALTGAGPASGFCGVGAAGLAGGVTGPIYDQYVTEPLRAVPPIEDGYGF